MLKIARENKSQVHGLGFTRRQGIKKYRFNSVDSTSWLSGPKFGGIYQFTGDSLKLLKKPTGKRIKDYRKLAAHNLKEWVKFQKYADKFL